LSPADAEEGAWQKWLRTHQPPTLVIWGRDDPLFQVEGAHAYQADLPQARIVILDAGHFALDEQPDQIASLARQFLDTIHSRTEALP
jgi:pimeloyl-ACP methyl ester carboxylesterase